MFEVVVLSGKGGTGKTSITAALAATGAQKVLADCDVDASDLHIVTSPTTITVSAFYSGELATITPDQCVQCGLCASKCHFGAIEKDQQSYTIRSEHCEGCGVCEYVCPTNAVIMTSRRCGEWYTSETPYGHMIHAALGIGEENSGKLVSTVRKQAAETASRNNIKLLLTDGPPGVGCPAIASLTNAHRVLLVTEPTLSALHDLQRIAELTRHFRIPSSVILNKRNVNPRIADELTAWCQTQQLPIIARLDWNTDFINAQLHGQSVVDYRPETWKSVFTSMWDKILDAPEHPFTL